MVSYVGESPKKPKIEATDDVFLLHLRVTKAGYGSLNEVEEFDARKMLQILNYENFISDYESAFLELSKK